MKKSKNTQPTSLTVPASFRAAVSALKGREPSVVTTRKEDFPVLLPVSAQLAAEEVELTGTLAVGEEVAPGGDIFIGTWTPKGRKGISLGKTFRLFAQPADISREKFVDLVERVAKLPNGFNHTIPGKTPDEALYGALRSGTYKGEYFIPTKDVLDMLFKNRNVGKLKGTFKTRSRSDSANWRWSCTEIEGQTFFVWAQKFSRGTTDWEHKIDLSLSGRLVRAELILPSGSSPKPQK